MNIVFMSMDTLPSTLWARDLYDQMQLHRTMTICCESLHLVEHLLSLQRMC